MDPKNIKICRVSTAEYLPTFVKKACWMTTTASFKQSDFGKTHTVGNDSINNALTSLLLVLIINIAFSTTYA